MARKVLSWSLKVLHYSQKFAEVRRDWICFAGFAEVRQGPPKFAKALQEPSSFSEGLQGSARLYEVLRRISKNTNMFHKILSASGSFHWVHKCSFFCEVLSSSRRIHKVPSSPTMVPKVPWEFHCGLTWFHRDR